MYFKIFFLFLKFLVIFLNFKDIWGGYSPPPPRPLDSRWWASVCVLELGTATWDERGVDACRQACVLLTDEQETGLPTTKTATANGTNTVSGHILSPAFNDSRMTRERATRADAIYRTQFDGPVGPALSSKSAWYGRVIRLCCPLSVAARVSVDVSEDTAGWFRPRETASAEHCGTRHGRLGVFMSYLYFCRITVTGT